MDTVKKRILVVDDDQSVRDSLKKILMDSGHEVSVAADGEAGAAQIQAGEFDLVVLDLDLPKLCGFDLLDLVGSGGSPRPVVVLSGMLAACEPESLAGADAVLEKPPDVDLLLSTVSGLLAGSPEARIRQAPTAAPSRTPRAAAASAGNVEDELRASAAQIRNL